MIINFFRNNYQVEVITIIIVGILLWLWGFSMIQPGIPAINAAPLAKPIFNIQHGWMTSAIALGILIIESFMISTITGRFKVLRLTNLLPSLVYILLMSFNQDFLTLTPALVSNFLVISLLYYLFDLYSAHNHLLHTFNASFIVGLATLIIPENFFLLLLIWISLIIYRNYGLREWIISISGIVIVFLFTASFYYLIDQFDSFIQSYAEYFSTLKPGLPAITSEFVPFLLVIALFTLVSLPRMLFKLDENIIRTRKRLNVVIFHIIVVLGIIFINPAHWQFTIYLLFIPLSVSISRLIISLKKERNKDWLLLLIILTIILERIL